MFDANGKMVNYELISPFVHLHSILQDGPIPETEGVVRSRSAKGHKKPTKGAFLFYMIGVLIVAVAGELLRKTRTSTLTQMTVPPKIPAKAGKL